MSKHRKSAFSSPASSPTRTAASPEPNTETAQADETGHAATPRVDMERANREGIVPGLRAVQQIVQIPIGEIDLNPDNPRRYPRDLSDEQIDALLGVPELAASIRANGLLQPPSVIPNPGDGAPYVILTGERRFRAMRALGFEVIPCLPKRDVTTASRATNLMLQENIQRRDLSPMQLAQAADAQRWYDEHDVQLATPLSWNAAEDRIRRVLNLTSYEYLAVRRLAQLGPDAQAALLLHDQMSAGVWYERLKGCDLDTPEGQAVALETVLQGIRADQATKQRHLFGPPASDEASDATSEGATSPLRDRRRPSGDAQGARMIALFRHTADKAAVGRPEFEVTVRVKREGPAARSDAKRRAEQAAVIEAAIAVLQEQLGTLS